MVLSGAINNRVSCSSQGGPYSIVVVTAGVGEQDSAADGSQQVLHTAPCVVLWAEAFTVIDADLEAFSPGRAAALGVRGGLAEGERPL